MLFASSHDVFNTFMCIYYTRCNFFSVMIHSVCVCVIVCLQYVAVIWPREDFSWRMENICALWTTSASTARAVTSVESLWRERWWRRSEKPTTQHALCAQSASKNPHTHMHIQLTVYRHFFKVNPTQTFYQSSTQSFILDRIVFWPTGDHFQLEIEWLSMARTVCVSTVQSQCLRDLPKTSSDRAVSTRTAKIIFLSISVLFFRLTILRRIYLLSQLS